MQTRFNTTTTNQEITDEGKRADKLLWARRAGVAATAGVLAVTLAGCEKDGFGKSDYEPGTIEETRAKLSDTAMVQCIDGTIYDLDGEGARISKKRLGKYREGRTNPVVVIKPESGGETLLLEQELNVFARPQELVISPLTDQGLLKEAGCDPADLPGDKDDYIIKYNVKTNTEELRRHGLIE